MIKLTCNDEKVNAALVDFANRLMTRGLVLQDPAMTNDKAEAEALRAHVAEAKAMLRPALLKPNHAVSDGIKSAIVAEVRRSWDYYMKIFRVSPEHDLQVTFPELIPYCHQGHMNVYLFPEAVHATTVCL